MAQILSILVYKLFAGAKLVKFPRLEQKKKIVMRISTLLRPSLRLSMLAGFLFTACGSYQSASYYSDGIYSSDNVIVVRRNKPQAQTNAYSQYFDEKAKQYNWNDNNATVVLTDVDSLNQGNLKNYQSNPNWGGGNKTTQIVIQNNPPFYGAGWGFGNWNFGYYNPYAWNNFAWGFNNPWRFNRWNRWNRWGWGYNYPFFSPFDPYFGNAFYYGNPYFYGGGYWNGYALNNRYWNRFDRRNQRNAVRNNRRVYSSSYRGQASSGGQRSTVATNRSASTRNNASPSTNSNRRSSLSPDEVVEVPNLVERGRTASVRNRQNNNENDARSRRQQTANEAQNRSQIDQVIRSLQNRGYNIQVINDTQRAREYSRQNPSGSMRNNNSSTNYSSGQEKGAPSSRRSYSNESNNTSSRSSNRSSRSNYSSSPSRSYSAPARVSSGGGRSSSGGSSSGRSSGGRRQ